MKNYSKWVLAATLICGICVISACDEKEKEIINDNQLATRILGKWIPVQSNGMEVMTDQKTVTTFKKTSSGLKAYTSVSSLVMPAQFQDPSKETVQTDEWHYNQPADVNIEENKFIITRAVNDTINQISKYYILESSDSTLELYISTRLSINGNEIMSSMGHTETWAKVNIDFSKEIVGLWEGHVTSDTSKYDDGETHRWRYNIDGTYIYYSQDQTGEWVEVESVFNNGIMLSAKMTIGTTPIMMQLVRCEIKSMVANVLFVGEDISSDGTTVTKYYAYANINPSAGNNVLCTVKTNTITLS